MEDARNGNLNSTDLDSKKYVRRVKLLHFRLIILLTKIYFFHYVIEFKKMRNPDIFNS